MYTMKNAVTGDVLNGLSLERVRAIIKNLHKKKVDLQTIEIHWDGHVWLAYEF